MSDKPPLRVVPARRPCPICGKPEEPRFRPFCSARCVDVDLGRWFKEGYRVETDEKPGSEDDGR